MVLRPSALPIGSYCPQGEQKANPIKGNRSFRRKKCRNNETLRTYIPITVAPTPFQAQVPSCMFP